MSNKEEPKTTKKDEFPFETAPKDIRYQNCNITRYCFQMYYDYQRCIRLYSPSHYPCTTFKKNYTSLCPNAWIDKWENQLKNDCFPRDFPNYK